MQPIAQTATAADTGSNSIDDKWPARKRRIRALKRVLIAKAEVRRLQALLAQKRVTSAR